jgi:AraC family transcriptional regulator
MAVELPELEVELVERSPQPALTLRHLGPYPEVGSAWQMLLAYVFRVLSPVGPIELLGVPWDDPDVTAPEHLRCDVGVALRDLHSLEPEPPFEIRELPGGRYAECMHRGAYEALSDSYAYVCGVWAPKHGEELRHAPSIEIYGRGPAAGVDSRDYRTRLFVPLD